jgi:hypothetical protein
MDVLGRAKTAGTGAEIIRHTIKPNVAVTTSMAAKRPNLLPTYVVAATHVKNPQRNRVPDTEPKVPENSHSGMPMGAATRDSNMAGNGSGRENFRLTRERSRGEPPAVSSDKPTK